jgi:hypothetical protein
MEEPSSLSWSNRYDLAYGWIHQSLSQEQGQPIDGPLQNEVEFQQLGNQNQEVMAFHQTAEQRQEDLNVQGQSVSDELHDYHRASSLQQFSFTPTASGENRRVSWGEILQVKKTAKEGQYTKWRLNFFENMVLKWSLQDIMDENLYKDKVSISYV